MFGVSSAIKYCHNCGENEVDYLDTCCERCVSRIFDDFCDVVKRNFSRKELLAIENKLEGMYITDIIYSEDEI